MAGEIAEKFARSARGVEALFYRIKRLLAECIRMRLGTRPERLPLG